MAASGEQRRHSEEAVESDAAAAWPLLLNSPGLASGREPEETGAQPGRAWRRNLRRCGVAAVWLALACAGAAVAAHRGTVALRREPVAAISNSPVALYVAPAQLAAVSEALAQPPAESARVEACEDTSGWTNGYTACNSHMPIDRDCTPEGVSCHFYTRNPEFCMKGMREPWRHCCACGGGSTFNGTRPVVTVHTSSRSRQHWLRWPAMLHMPSGLNKLEHKLGGIRQEVLHKVGPAADALDEVYEGLRAPDYGKPPELAGNATEDINHAALLVGMVVSSVTLLGCLFEICCRRFAMQGRPQAWSMALLFISYLLLIPGLSSVVFSFDIVANIIGHRIDLQPDKSQKSCTESITGLVELLYTTGSTPGAILVVLYAIVVPAMKLLLLALGEFLRSSKTSAGITQSRTCIVIVQHISKWASPDMFAYILLVYLVRDLNHDPTILTAARLDVGFTCFSIFCVCSTVSSLGISLPASSRASEGLVDVDVHSPRRPLLICCVGKGGVVFVAIVLTFAFSILFAVGLYLPCMALRIDDQALYPRGGSVPTSAKLVLDSLDIPELLSTDVSLWKCMGALFVEVGHGEVNSLLALTMLAVFVVALSMADMLLLVAAALRLRHAGEGSAAPSGPCGRPCPFMAVARVLRKLSMLDVCIMGVYVVTYCLAIYAKNGIIVSTRRGLSVLLAAEVIHAVTYFAVSAAVDYSGSQIRGFEEAGLSLPHCHSFGCNLGAAEDLDDQSMPDGFKGSCCISMRRLNLLEGLSQSSPRPMMPPPPSSQRWASMRAVSLH